MQLLKKIQICYNNKAGRCGSDSKESICNVGALGSMTGLGRSPGEGKGCPLQYSGLENSTDRGAWQGTVHRVAELATTKATKQQQTK